MAGVTGLEPATSGVTGRRSNQLSYTPGAEAVSIDRVLRTVNDGAVQIGAYLAVV